MKSLVGSSRWGGLRDNELIYDILSCSYRCLRKTEMTLIHFLWTKIISCEIRQFLLFGESQVCCLLFWAHRRAPGFCDSFFLISCPLASWDSKKLQCALAEAQAPEGVFPLRSCFIGVKSSSVHLQNKYDNVPWEWRILRSLPVWVLSNFHSQEALFWGPCCSGWSHNILTKPVWHDQKMSNIQEPLVPHLAL